MHAHRSAAPPAGVARPGDPGFEPQRRLLLELAVDPPPTGDALADLVAALGFSRRELEAAAAVLARVGLCARRGDRLRGTAALRAVEALCPLGR